jgi:hypothetical protein
VVGTGGNWFLWDVAFYGLKLYSGPIFKAINPGGAYHKVLAIRRLVCPLLSWLTFSAFYIPYRWPTRTERMAPFQ